MIIAFLLKRLGQHAFGNVSILMLSGLASQVINFAAYAFMTRVYTASDFGLFNAVNSLATFGGAAILLRFDLIYQIAESSEEEDILRMSAILGVGLSLFICIVVLVFGPTFSNYFLAESTAVYWHWSFALVLAIMALANGLISLSRQVSVKHGAYKKFAMAQTARTLVMVGAQLGLGFLYPSPITLLAGAVLGICATLGIAWPFRKGLFLTFFASPMEVIVKSKNLLSRYKAYISVDLVNALISASAIAIYPVFVLSAFGATEAGLYGIASRLALIPNDILGKSISTVYFQRFSEAVRSGKGMSRMYLTTLFVSVLFAVVIAFVLALLAGPLVWLLFPTQWTRAGTLLIYILPTAAAQFTIGCISNTPLSIRRPQLLLGWNIAQIAVIAISLFVSRGGTLEFFLLASGIGLLGVSFAYAFVLFYAVDKMQSRRQGSEIGIV